MDLFYTVHWRCSEDSDLYNKMIEKDRVFDFLNGLNSELDEVRERILGTKPLPSLKEVFSEVRKEESRRRVMLNQQSEVAMTNQNSTLATFTREESLLKNPGREKQWCDHCKKSYHTKENC